MGRRDVAGFLAAYAEAAKSDMPIAKVGAVVTWQGRIIGRGHNLLRTDPEMHRWNRFRELAFDGNSVPRNMDAIHAEVRAIKSVPYVVARRIRWSQARVYVYRIAPGLPLGQGMARPCPACMRALCSLGVRRIAYSDETGLRKERLL